MHFFDESSTSVVRTTGNRNYGSSAKGSRAFELQRYVSNANYTINLLHSRFGVDYFNVTDDASNSMEIIQFFADVVGVNNDKIANGFQIQPLFVPGDTIIMVVNNYLPQLLMQTGVVLKFQPLYHPQLNTCEYCFHVIKQILRSDSDFTFDHTRTTICNAIIDGVTFEKLENIFKHCGYIH